MANLPSHSPNNHLAHTRTAGTVPSNSTTSIPSSQRPARVTRSAARLASEASASTNLTRSPHALPQTQPSSKKRKATTTREASPIEKNQQSSSPTTPRRSKRQKIEHCAEEKPVSAARAGRPNRRKGQATDTAMSNNGSSSKYADESLKQVPAKLTSKRSNSRNDKTSLQDNSASKKTTPMHKQKRRPSKKDLDTTMKQADESKKKHSKGEKASTPPVPQDQSSESDDGESPNQMEDDRTDPFSTALFGGTRGPPSGLSSTLRALSGMMSGMSSRLRDILNNLRQVDNPTMQLVALEELSNLLLVSNEDNLSGQFSPDPYVKELVALMQPNPITGEENPEMMLLACRCIANLMEALRGSVANVVYGGAVPVLCQKLLDIQYIDVAEQALSTLSKVSVDFPASIVREGGMTACLQFLDFFATGTQRTAVTTAANCCRNIPHDSFPVIRDVMPILQNVLVSHDQKVVEQGSLCVTRVIDSFKHSKAKIEQLVDPGLLKAILALLLPGTTNLIGANIHTEFLRVLAIIAKASPKLSAELLKLNVVDTLYQILTGVSPPVETSGASSKIDSVMVMQALIHRPREQVYETLNVICELLPRPKVASGVDFEIYDGFDETFSDNSIRHSTKKSATEKRLQLLEDCKQETRRFAMVLLPTLTDAYSSTVNLSVRQKVLTAQLKILSNMEIQVIEDALRPVPYASFLASILSQEDHPSLVMYALQASELLFERLEGIYQYRFHREGVVGEIKRLAERSTELKNVPSLLAANKEAQTRGGMHTREKVDSLNIRGFQALNGKEGFSRADEDDGEEIDEEDDGEDEDGNEDGDENNEDDDDDDPQTQDEDNDDDDEIIVRDENDLDDSQSSDSSDDDVPSPVVLAGINDLVIVRAKKFLERYETSRGRDLKIKATKIREDLRRLGNDIEFSYGKRKHVDDGKPPPFLRLAQYFDADALESITSSELLESGLIRILAEILNDQKTSTSKNPRADFLSAFMCFDDSIKSRSSAASSASTAFSILIQKLQDLLSRAEHFEVLTVNNNASESSRSSSTSMLSRQLRLRLTADADSDIPQSYREMIVSIHAIATLKALDDYLRPRFSLSDRPTSALRRRDMLQQLASARMAQLSGAADSGLFAPFGQELSSSSPPPGLRGDACSTTRLSSRSKLNMRERQLRDENKPVEKNDRRRSARRSQASSSAAPLQTPTESGLEGTTAKLECADEKVIQDDDGPTGNSETLETFVSGMEDDMSDEDLPEPGAVNMEVASTGKVTVRQEDGTRVLTPQPGTPVPGTARSLSAPQHPGASLPTGGLPNAGRPSYAAALAAVPQDWHIEFSIDDEVIPNNTTIYRAVHHNRDPVQHSSSRSVWSGVHTVKFRKVKGPPPDQPSLSSRVGDLKQEPEGSLPSSLNGHPVTSSILALLQILHDLNTGLDDFRESLGPTGLRFNAEPLVSFINTKLTAKMNRQLEEPLIVASHCLPDWAEDLAGTFPFLFPFETRHLFLQSTSFGYSRSITRWQNTQSENDERRDRRREDRPVMGRPQRQKVRISRSRILESAMKVMEMYGPSPSVLEVEYFEEVGTGLGPTLEFYATVSKEFSKKKLKMWRENDSVDDSEFVFGKSGLFPAPMSVAECQLESGKKLLYFFKTLGKFVARSMLDSRIIDISFSSTFFKLGSSSSITPSVALLRNVDQDLANSIAHIQRFANAKANILEEVEMNSTQKSRAVDDLTLKGVRIEDLMLDFTLPGYPSIELIDGGSNVNVTMSNVELYVERVLDLSLGSGIRQQIEAFQTGFSHVFSYSSLKVFTPSELAMLFGRVEEDWSIETLMDSVKADHGFNMDSKSVKNLLQTMSELAPAQRRDFLQFVTGSPKLPIGGFKSLTPMFTVVCKPSEPPYTSDDYLPSVMTCVNYLKLPDYSNQETLKERLNMAIKEGQGAFHLS